MNTSVGDQLLDGKFCNLSPYGIECRYRNHIGGIVYYQVHSCAVLDSADVATHSAYETTFHVVAGERNRGYGYLRSVVRRASLHRKSDYVLSRLFYLLGFDGSVLPHFVKQLLHEYLLGLFGSHTRYAL